MIMVLKKVVYFFVDLVLPVKYDLFLTYTIMKVSLLFCLLFLLMVPSSRYCIN